LLLLEVTISGCVFVLAQAFMALGRPGVVTLLQAVGLFLSLPMMLLLIPRWGIQGAAVALLTSTCARFIFIYLGFRLVLKVPAPSLLPRKEDFFILVSALKRVTGAPAA
jgi:O-antigen/teichoic acid export membrane protein